MCASPGNRHSELRFLPAVAFQPFVHSLLFPFQSIQAFLDTMQGVSDLSQNGRMFFHFFEKILLRLIEFMQALDHRLACSL